MIRRLLIAPPMSEAEAAEWTTASERDAARSFAPRRRAEYLSWRAMLRRELGADVQIAYDAVGAPVLPGRTEQISVAHCAGRVVVAIAESRCAVDVEAEQRDFSRAASHYLSATERRLSDDPRLPAVVWCAKETLYKYAGQPGLDLLHDLHVERVDFAAGEVLGRIGCEAPVRLSLRCGDGFVLTVLF